jgi:four helix bundle protein
MGDFKKLEVWHRAYRLALATYRVTGSFPKSELYGMVSQMRRAAVSIPTNIAEGCGRKRDGEATSFLRYSLGSTSELDCLIMLARDLGYLSQDAYQSLADEVAAVGRMLTALIRHFSSKRKASSRR